jgi:hypothetical protein
MPKTIRYKAANRPFAHMFFFQLCDTSQELVAVFTDLCVQYLGGHPGQRHFSVGIRALEINRDVSGTNFEVSVHMIFDSIADFTKYSASDSHEEFITQSAGMSPVRIVYDSYLMSEVLTEEQEAKGTLKAKVPSGKGKAVRTTK